jgi:hypothetical protein
MSNSTIVSKQLLRHAHMRRSLDISNASCVDTGVEEAISLALIPYSDDADALDAKEQQNMTMAMDGEPPFRCPYCWRVFTTVYLLKYARV